jgi:3-isopropylmalate/(R)-2-methylmalate dehydratase small subunit
MNPVKLVHGRAYPLGRDNIDTDLIIGAKHLKTVSRTGLGRFAFETLRADPGNLFDDPSFAFAPILIAGANFGCGSSREHAVWALADFGVRAVIAPSFSDIFAANAYKNGMVTVEISSAQAAKLMEAARTDPIMIDIEALTVTAAGMTFAFELDHFRRDCLLRGLDEISLTLTRENAIKRYEQRNDGWQYSPGAG